MDFEEYARDRKAALFTFAVVLCGDRVLADELTNDALSRAYENWHRVSAVDNVHAYVRRILINDYVKWQRGLSRTAPHADLTALLPAASDHASVHADRVAMLGELERLPRRQRTVVVLRYYEGLSDAEIAEALGTEPVTVRSNIHRALKKLRIQLAGESSASESPATLMRTEK